MADETLWKRWDYHLEEVNFRRKRQWDVFAWAVTVLTAVTAASLTAFRDARLGIGEAIAISGLELLVVYFAVQQMIHDRSVAAAHWNEASHIQQSVPELKSFSDEYAKIKRRLSFPVLLMCFLAFAVAVTAWLCIRTLYAKPT